MPNQPIGGQMGVKNNPKPPSGPSGGGEGNGPAGGGGKNLPVTADTSSPSAPAKGGQGNVKGTVLVGKPIEPGPPRPADNVKVQIKTADGVKEMTAGEYRQRYRQAEEWITKQLQDYHWGNGGQRPDQQEMTKQAAEKFGLDPSWRSVNNPIIYGGKI
jgi:hypothetical protein